MKIKGLILILLTSLCWGPNFLFMKVAVPEIPPLTLVLLRVGIGALLLFSISLLQKASIWKWMHLWKTFFVMALTMNVIPFTLICGSELYISSALAGVLNSLAIIFIAVIAHYFGPHDPLTKNRIAGILSSIAGLLIIYFPILIHGKLGHSIGILMMVLSGVSYGVGAVYVRIHLQKVPPMIAITSQMIMATIILLPLSLFIDRPFSLPVPSSDAIYSTLALGAIGTGLGLLFYYQAIKLAGATYATLSVFLVSIFAIILGSIFLHEQITWNLYLGTFFILLGLLGVNPVFDKPSK